MQELENFADYLVSQWSEPPLPLTDETPPDFAAVTGHVALPSCCRYRPWHWFSISHHRSWNTWKAGGTTTCSLKLPIPARNNMWWCNSLSEASVHYSWWSPSGTGSFASLSCQLQGAMRTGNVTAAANACRLVFSWGGVALKKSNKSRLWLDTETKHKTLIASLRSAALQLQPSTTPWGAFVPPMNSATTKLFAAADHTGKGIIFDGRVGAALCLLVREYLRQHKIMTVPPSLEFFWGPAQNSPSSRNPSKGSYVFRNINAVGNVARAQASHRANILANMVSTRLGITARTFETALFMIGYRVPP